jgi:hypothetical protein
MERKREKIKEAIEIDALRHMLKLYERDMARVEIGIGMLRQWLNEDRITDPKKMVTSEVIKDWLFGREGRSVKFGVAVSSEMSDEELSDILHGRG